MGAGESPHHHGGEGAPSGGSSGLLRGEGYGDVRGAVAPAPSLSGRTVGCRRAPGIRVPSADTAVWTTAGKRHHFPLVPETLALWSPTSETERPGVCVRMCVREKEKANGPSCLTGGNISFRVSECHLPASFLFFQLLETFLAGEPLTASPWLRNQPSAFAVAATTSLG